MAVWVRLDRGHCQTTDVLVRLNSMLLSLSVDVGGELTVGAKPRTVDYVFGTAV